MSSSSSSSSSSLSDLSRIHFWHYVLNSEGGPIQNAEIRIYLNDDPTKEANIFLTETSSVFTTSSVAELKTNSDGFFEVWFGSEFEDGGYDHKQEFRLEWYKAGISPGVIQAINPWPNTFSWNNINSGVDLNHKNKFVSDFLANKWWTHFNSIVPSANPHNLKSVDFNSGCVNNNKYNKVVSNKMLKDIIDWSVAESTEVLTYGGVVEDQRDITSWITSSGIFYNDISHTSIKSESVAVQIIKLSDNNQIEPKRITNIDNNTTRIFLSSEVNVRVSIQGSSSSSSSMSSSSSSST